MRKLTRNLAVTALAASALAGGSTAATASAAPVSTHASHQLPAWLHWAWAPRTAHANCHGGPAVIVWVAGHRHRGVLACEENEILWPGAPSRPRSPRTPPAWLHWTRATSSADCHGGPAEILWIRESDQSAKACSISGIILPS